MNKRKKIYISLPISNRSVKEAREHADRVALSLSKQGWIVVNPFNIYAGHEPTYEDYICSDLRAMLDCDAICFCEGWMHSCGCNVEHSVAMTFKAYDKKDFQIVYE